MISKEIHLNQTTVVLTGNFTEDETEKILTILQDIANSIKLFSTGTAATIQNTLHSSGFADVLYTNLTGVESGTYNNTVYPIIHLIRSRNNEEIEKRIQELENSKEILNSLLKEVSSLKEKIKQPVKKKTEESKVETPVILKI